MFGLPFPTYIGWFLGPLSMIGTVAFVYYHYRKFLKEQGKKTKKIK